MARRPAHRPPVQVDLPLAPARRRPPAAKASTKKAPAARKKASPRPPAAGAEFLDVVTRLRDVTADITRHGESLTRSIAETPRPEEFQPLADHLYEFARLAPRVMDILAEFPQVTAPLAENVAALRAVADTLADVNHGFSDSLLRLPRAEDYEPLAEPLRRFATTSPALLGALEDVLRATMPLARSVTALQSVAGSLAASHERLELRLSGMPRPEEYAQVTVALREFATVAPALADKLAQAPRLVAALQEALAGRPGSTTEAAREAREIAELVAGARRQVEEALASIPAESDYRPAAAQLREIASVSPSLLEWLHEVPRLATPLGAAVAGLHAAGQALTEAAARLDAHADALAPDGARFDRPPSRP